MLSPILHRAWVYCDNYRNLSQLNWVISGSLSLPSDKFLTLSREPKFAWVTRRSPLPILGCEKIAMDYPLRIVDMENIDNVAAGNIAVSPSLFLMISLLAGVSDPVQVSRFAELPRSGSTTLHHRLNWILILIMYVGTCR